MYYRNSAYETQNNECNTEQLGEFMVLVTNTETDRAVLSINKNGQWEVYGINNVSCPKSRYDWHLDSDADAYDFLVG